MDIRIRQPELSSYVNQSYHHTSTRVIIKRQPELSSYVNQSYHQTSTRVIIKRQPELLICNLAKHITIQNCIYTIFILEANKQNHLTLFSMNVACYEYILYIK